MGFFRWEIDCEKYRSHVYVVEIDSLWWEIRNPPRRFAPPLRGGEFLGDYLKLLAGVTAKIAIDPFYCDKILLDIYNY